MSVRENMKEQVKLRSDIPSFLKHNCLDRRLCEVGTRYGYYFQQLLSVNPDLLVSVDHFQSTDNKAEQDTNLDQDKLNKIYGDVFMRFLHNPSVKIYRGKSKDAVNLFPLKFFDFVYIDADHSFDGAYKDICLWWARIRQGGVLAGHDYIEAESQNGVEFGVIQAVEKFMKDLKVKPECLHHTNDGYRTWLLFKEEGE